MGYTGRGRYSLLAPTGIKPTPTGQWLTQQISSGTASSTIAGAANRLSLSVFYTPRPISVDTFAVNVTTGVASANVRVLIYSSSPSTGIPVTKLYESGNLSAATSATYPSEAASFRFAANTLYWVGVHHSSTATVRGMAIASCLPIGLASGTGTTENTELRTTPTFGSALATYSYSSANGTSAITPLVYFRVA